MPNVITVENLAKSYLLSHQSQQPYAGLRDVLSEGAKWLGGKVLHPLGGRSGAERTSQEEFWALKEVSFEVKQGERVGIVGRNGAGKSTLLKILSRITEPSAGSARIRGRVASLLEVGTGFHPELTGRENIFLNGAILGMSRAEIKCKFDQIVDFAEIERFLDTPVKRYSSGMYVRLAFAVAAHLEPEILIVDEVLAVGDQQFQKKCLGRMEEAGKQGRTVLFVSHNMAAVENLCQTGIVLDQGGVVFNGKITEAVKSYLNTFSPNTGGSDLAARENRQGNGQVRITDLTIVDSSGNRNIPFQIGAELFFHISYQAQGAVKNPHLIIGVYDLMNVGVTRFDTEIAGSLPASLPASGCITCSTKGVPLVPGRYQLNLAFISNGVMQDYLAAADYLDIIGSDYFNSGKIFNESDSKLTKVLIKHQWGITS